MKRRLGAALAALVLLGGMPIASRAVGTSASSAILMDAGSGRVLYEQNPHEKRLIASITKLLTALVALESGHALDEKVPILEEYTRAEGSSVYLKAGDTFSLKTLLYGLLLHSGNDAALAVAGYCGGSVEDFVARMNDKAAALGMENSHFSNPNGLNADDHYSTAYDMALLAKACLAREDLIAITSTRSVSVEGRSFANHNKLLWRYEGCIGLKTGFTEKAGRTLISAARREGTTLIAVTLNDPDDWRDHAALLDYGFANYRTETVVTQGETVARLPVRDSLCQFVPVAAAEGALVLLGAGETLEKELILDAQMLQAPVTAGREVGRLVCTVNGAAVKEIPLICAAGAENCLAPKLDLWQRLRAHWSEE